MRTTTSKTLKTARNGEERKTIDKHPTKELKRNDGPKAKSTRLKSYYPKNGIAGLL